MQYLEAIEGKLQPISSLETRITTLETLVQNLDRHPLAASSLADLSPRHHDNGRHPWHRPPNDDNAADLPPRGQGGGRHHQRHADEDEDDEGNGELLPTAHKLEFPKYDGASDPLP
ncbi:hypothetical protein GUJ93_ZPchr0006g46359 [Zizania palustris]|uniref:Uncharacterized protein n=1 Tax=Zizania palustris TaxID=103762 RepID=A0A8J5SM28_ZIZPA|nr:hypothetical protein GUJ93_ZPchr0006g46359 [Zizania palustris]